MFLTTAVLLCDKNTMHNPKTVTLSFDVTFDEDITDAESVASAFDILITTGMNTTGILEDYGPLDVGDTELRGTDGSLL